MSTKSERDDGYTRGYSDAKEGIERTEHSSDGFLESIVDGFFGGSLSEKKERFREAYNQGYRDGASQRTKDTGPKCQGG